MATSSRSKISQVEAAPVVTEKIYTPQRSIKVENVEPPMLGMDSPRRYPSRNRAAVKRLDPSDGTGGSYDKALVQYICMAQVADKHEQKRLFLHKGLKV